MELRPVLIDEDKTKEIYDNPYCQNIFQSYPAYYHKIGYNPPWIGYFVLRDGKVVGVGGFTGKPTEGRVEIAYGTCPELENQGIASFTCRQLISIARTTDPVVTITAKTAPEMNASANILQKAGFQFTGVVQDEGIGDAWEWVLIDSLI
jgi:[ribosomal protein S5]-alanine N-acetyltransferase